ncbi:MAG: hypothetical protein BWY83_01791 [bacterium ADurb.Bin478]|nr:MAG: hypothetical protein BWY83_01791 [bacterium ADurb.Bin478]
MQAAFIVRIYAGCGRGLGADESDIPPGWTGAGFVRRAGAVIIGFKAVGPRDIGDLRIADAKQELQFALVTEIAVKIIIKTAVGDEIFGVDGSAEPFVGIIVCIADLNVVYLRAAADTAKREAVDFIVR